MKIQKKNLFKDIEIEWGRCDLKPFHNLRSNAVFYGFQRGVPIVLKFGNDNELIQEAIALNAFERFGMVRILNQKKCPPYGTYFPRNNLKIILSRSRP